MHFIRKAQGKKPILELETMDDQLSLLFDNTMNDNLIVKHTILEWDKTEEQLGMIISLWNDGDANKMSNLIIEEPLEEHPELLPIYQSFFFERNTRMASKIEAFLKTKQIYFVIVGSGHLIGEKGIINLLKKRSYSIRQL